MLFCLGAFTSIAQTTSDELFQGGFDDKVLFTPNGKDVIWSWHKSVNVWDATTGNWKLKPTKGIPFEAKGGFKVQDFSLDGKLMLTAGGGYGLLWDIETWEVVDTFKGSFAFAEFRFDDKYIVSASDYHPPKIWHLETGELGRELEGVPQQVGDIHFSPNGKFVTAAYRSHGARLWDAESGELLEIIAWHGSKSVEKVFFSPDSKYIVTLASHREAVVSLVENGRVWKRYKVTDSFLHDGTISLNGELLILVGSNLAAAYNMTSGELHYRLTDAGSSQVVKIEKRGLIGAAGFNDGTVKIFKVSDGSIIHNIEGHLGKVTSCDFSSDGTRLVTCSNDRKAKIWNVETGELIVELKE